MWIAYDDSRARLPVAWADSAAALSRMVGVSDLTIRSTACRGLSGEYGNPKYMKVEVEDEDDDRRI